jgi:hypothetical protein
MHSPLQRDNDSLATGFGGVRHCLLSALLMVGLSAAAWGQHRITFKSGVVHECKILGFENGIFTVQLANGVKASTSQGNITRIEFDVVKAPAVPPEFSRVKSAAPASAPSPPPVSRPAVAPAAPPKPPPATPPRPGIQLTMASHWQHRLGRGTITHRDAARLLAKCGSPKLDPRWQDITLWGKVTYLMPVNKAKKLLGLGRSSRKNLSGALFPPSSFFAHEFAGHFEGGMTRLTLVTDFDNQVVAVQLSDSTTRPDRWLRHPTAYSADWSLYDLVNDGRKGNSTWEVGFFVARGTQRILGYPPGNLGTVLNQPIEGNNGVIRIDSDLYSFKKNRWGLVEDGRSRERARLFLAQPVVDLMLYIIQQSR